MFDKLKGAIGDSGIKNAVEKYSPQILEKLQGISKLNVADVKDDDRFKSIVIDPALFSIKAASSGATSLISNFDNRFSVALLHARNELVVVDEPNNKVSLASDCQARLVDVLIEGFKKST